NLRCGISRLRRDGVAQRVADLDTWRRRVNRQRIRLTLASPCAEQTQQSRNSGRQHTQHTQPAIEMVSHALGHGTSVAWRIPRNGLQIALEQRRLLSKLCFEQRN